MLDDAGMTSSSLIQRLKSREDEDAWEEFCALYQPLLEQYVRRTGVPAADVADVVQNLLLSVYSALPQFEYQRGYKGGFRGYLFQCIRSKVMDYWRSRKRRAPHVSLIEECDPSEADPQTDMWDRQYTEYFLQKSFEAVRPSIPDETWELFLASLKGDPDFTEDWSRRLGISSQAVHSRVFRVVEKLREHVRRIDPELWPEA